MLQLPVTPSACSLGAMACSTCGYFKAIVQIRFAAPEQLKKTFQWIRQQKKRAPKFVLRHMHPFMCAECVLLLCIARNNDMTQRDGSKRQAGYGFAQYGGAWRKADFEHAANALELCANDACKAGSADT